MDIRLKKAHLLILASGGLSSPAIAQQSEGDNGLYFRVTAGAVLSSDLTQSLEFDPAIDVLDTPVTLQQTEINEGISFGGAIGFHYPGGTRTELEYRYSTTDISSISRTGGVAPETLSANDDFVVQLLMSNFYKDFDNSSAFTPYVGFGVGGAFVSNGFGQRDSEFAYQGKAGVAVDLDEGLTFDVEYNYTRTTSLEFGPDFENLSSSSNEARLSGDAYAASSILFSLRKEF